MSLERYFISSCSVAASAVELAPPSACDGKGFIVFRFTEAYGIPDGES